MPPCALPPSLLIDANDDGRSESSKLLRIEGKLVRNSSCASRIAVTQLCLAAWLGAYSEKLH